jgi:hypothetical protein
MRKQGILCFSAAIQFGPTNIGKHVTLSRTVIRLSFPSCATHNRFPIDSPSILVARLEKKITIIKRVATICLSQCESAGALIFVCMHAVAAVVYVGTCCRGQ